MPKKRDDRLSDSHIETLVNTICDTKTDQDHRAEALLVLLDGVAERSSEIAMVAKRLAFHRCSDDVMQAQIDLLQGEIL